MYPRHVVGVNVPLYDALKVAYGLLKPLRVVAFEGVHSLQIQCVGLSIAQRWTGYEIGCSHFDLQRSQRMGFCRPSSRRATSEVRRRSRTKLVCDEFDRRTVSMSASELGIASEQGSAQGFGERDIRSIIGRQRIAQLPDSAYQG